MMIKLLKFYFISQYIILLTKRKRGHLADFLAPIIIQLNRLFEK